MYIIIQGIQTDIYAGDLYFQFMFIMLRTIISHKNLLRDQQEIRKGNRMILWMK